jgi:hypothetical protein
MFNMVIGKLETLRWSDKTIWIHTDGGNNVCLQFGKGYISVLRYLWGKRVMCLYDTHDMVRQIGPHK